MSAWSLLPPGARLRVEVPPTEGDGLMPVLACGELAEPFFPTTESVRGAWLRLAAHAWRSHEMQLASSEPEGTRTP